MLLSVTPTCHAPSRRARCLLCYFPSCVTTESRRTALPAPTRSVTPVCYAVSRSPAPQHAPTTKLQDFI
ncbi:hypothetical protein E2C01_061158 [Portunus trituberculatus]|uniref:Uncharacterized protein n=1 Tax=Portunus trituberculatus TaxID=210409 RepID=A0A5B7HDM1_PORTR|nr:hypothetical protein [Portunus trituberculatus]